MDRHIWLAAAALLALALPGCFLDWSPDGKQLVVVWGKGDNKGGLALVNVDGTGLQFIPGGDKGVFPSWSPDGRYILFATDFSVSENKVETHLYDTRLRTARRLAGELGPPYVWREDGRRFACFRNLEGGGMEAVWYNLPEGGITFHVKLPVSSIQSMNQQMVWLPGTDDIAFIGGNEKGSDVYTVEAGEVKKITTTGDVIGLGLSGDRKKLVWARKSPNLKYILMSVYAFDLKTRSSVRLPFPDRVPALNPDPRHAPRSVDYVTFSPDGARLALVAQTTETGRQTKTPRSYQVIYSLRMDGSDARLVRKIPQRKALEPTSMMFPCWSRDGKRLAVFVGEEKSAALAVYNADGSGGARLLSWQRK
jgi:Tol biopolymer transport system component